MRAVVALAVLALVSSACSESTSPTQNEPEFLAATQPPPKPVILKSFMFKGKLVHIWKVTPDPRAARVCAPFDGGQKPGPSCGSGGGGGGGGTMPPTYVPACTTATASMGCALQFAGLVLTGGGIAGSCGASWTGAGAVACAILVVGFGNEVTNFIDTPDCAPNCYIPPSYPSIGPLQWQNAPPGGGY